MIWDGCEWDPVNRRRAQRGDGHHESVEATLIVGAVHRWRLCPACAELPRFKIFKTRRLIRKPDVVAAPPEAASVGRTFEQIALAGIGRMPDEEWVSVYAARLCEPRMVETSAGLAGSALAFRLMKLLTAFVGATGWSHLRARQPGSSARRWSSAMKLAEGLRVALEDYLKAEGAGALAQGAVSESAKRVGEIVDKALETATDEQRERLAAARAEIQRIAGRTARQSKEARAKARAKEAS